MKKLERIELKNLRGGKIPPLPTSWCSATVNCSNGTTITLTCEQSQAGCVGIDASSSGNGYAYCQQNGVVEFASCSVN